MKLDLITRTTLSFSLLFFSLLVKPATCQNTTGDQLAQIEANLSSFRSQCANLDYITLKELHSYPDAMVGWILYGETWFHKGWPQKTSLTMPERYGLINSFYGEYLQSPKRPSSSGMNEFEKKRQQDEYKIEYDKYRARSGQLEEALSQVADALKNKPIYATEFRFHVNVGEYDFEERGFKIDVEYAPVLIAGGKTTLEGCSYKFKENSKETRTRYSNKTELVQGLREFSYLYKIGPKAAEGLIVKLEETGNKRDFEFTAELPVEQKTLLSLKQHEKTPSSLEIFLVFDFKEVPESHRVTKGLTQEQWGKRVDFLLNQEVNRRLIQFFRSPSSFKDNSKGASSHSKLSTAVIGGKNYKTAQIGDLVWMAENLDFNLSQDDGCSTADCEKYGRIYTHGDAQRVADAIEGWHLPSKAELDNLYELAASTGSQETRVGAKLKSFSGWEGQGVPRPENGNNLLGFNAIPIDFNLRARFWSSSNSYREPMSCRSRQHWALSIGQSNGQCMITEYCDSELHSVRLVRDLTFSESMNLASGEDSKDDLFVRTPVVMLSDIFEFGYYKSKWHDEREWNSSTSTYDITENENKKEGFWGVGRNNVLLQKIGDKWRRYNLVYVTYDTASQEYVFIDTNQEIRISAIDMSIRFLWNSTQGDTSHFKFNGRYRGLVKLDKKPE